MNGFWVLMLNEGGELDREFAKTEVEAAQTLVAMVQKAGRLQHGDRFAVEEGWSEQD